MTNLWKWGATAPIIIRTQPGDPLVPGCLVWLEQGRARPASALAPRDNAAHTAEAFAERFLGVAMHLSDGMVRVATTGVFLFQSPHPIIERRDWIGIHADDDGRPCNDTVIPVPDIGMAIGRATQTRRGAGPIHVEICSCVEWGGPPNMGDLP